jgi:hypothetical protein
LRRWLGASCALALICACSLPRALAQASAPTPNPPLNPSSNAGQPQAGTHSESNAAADHSSKTRPASLRRNRKRKKAARGQQKIDPERAQAIQQALIREHYLSGQASGTWNQASEDAMRRYQADHGWQSKTVPDARALISLGLGPSHDHLLNPESAMTTGPAEPHAGSVTPAPQAPVAHGADPGTHTSTNPTPPADPPPGPLT